MTPGEHLEERDEADLEGAALPVGHVAVGARTATVVAHPQVVRKAED